MRPGDCVAGLAAVRAGPMKRETTQAIRLQLGIGDSVFSDSDTRAQWTSICRCRPQTIASPATASLRSPAAGETRISLAEDSGCGNIQVDRPRRRGRSGHAASQVFRPAPATEQCCVIPPWQNIGTRFSIATHRDRMSDTKPSVAFSRDPVLSPRTVYFVAVVGFTFEFHSWNKSVRR